MAEMYASASQKLKDHDEYETEANVIQSRLERGDKELTKIWKNTRKLSLNDFKNIYKELGVKFDVWFYESEVEKEGKRIAGELLKKGIARRDQGALLIDLKNYDLDVFFVLKLEGFAL